MPSDLSPAPASVRIRQVALCTDDIWRDEQRIVAELGVAGVHRDPPNVFEMRNTVFAVGDTFLEILQPESERAPSAKFLAKRGGPGGYMLIMQVDDIDAARRRVDALGIRVVHDAPPTRLNGVEASAVHLHPGDTGGAIMSFDHMSPADGWAYAGRAWKDHVHTEVVERIVGVELTSAEPDALADRFARLVGRDLGTGRAIHLDDSVVRIVEGAPGTRDQLSAVELATTDRDLAGTTRTIAGTSIRLVMSQPIDSYGVSGKAILTG
jgi:hypothetical protein